MISIEVVKVLLLIVPTVLFLLTIIAQALIGLLNGFRRSVIFLVHAVSSFVVCLILYFIFVGIPSTDTFILNLVNLFMGEGGLQRALGVSTDITGLQDVFIEFLKNLLSGTGFDVVIPENINYVFALANMIYRLAFALILYVFYLLLNLILFIVYLIFYSNGRSKKRHRKAFSNGLEYKSFHHDGLYGALIGGVRGFIGALISFSLIGTFLYVIAGESSKFNNEDINKIEFSDKDVNYYTDLYLTVSNYDEHGVFKVLNGMRGFDDTPLYLYFSDLVYSGAYLKLNDDGTSEYTRINLRRELSSYTIASKHIINLVYKYNPEGINKIINGTYEGDVYSYFAYLLMDKNFQAEFKESFMYLNNSDFVFSMALGIVDSVAANIDSFDFGAYVDVTVRELLKVSFKKGHYSNLIKLERNAILESNTEEVLPYIKSSYILNINDLGCICDMVFAYYDNVFSDMFTIVTKMLPYAEGLSILKTDSNIMNPFFARIFEYCNENYLDNLNLVDTNEVTFKYASNLETSEYKNVIDAYDNGIDWIGDLGRFLLVSNDVYTIYKNIYDPNEVPSIDIFFKFFDDENIEYYNRVYDVAISSGVVGTLLSTGFIENLLDATLSNLSNSYTKPSDIIYQNYYDKNNNLVNGEVYYFFNAIRCFNDKEKKELLYNLINGEEVDVFKLIEKLAEKDSNGEVASDYILNSKYLEAIISAFIIENQESINLIIPNEVLLKNSNIIDKNELSVIFENISVIQKLLSKISGDVSNDELDEIISQNEYYNVINNSRIVQANASKAILSLLISGENIPDSISDPTRWINKVENGEIKSKGELLKLIDILKNNSISVSIMNDQESIMDLLRREGFDFETFTDSLIIRYAISSVLESESSTLLVIPNSSYENYGSNNSGSINIIKQKELITLLTFLKDFNFGEEIEFNKLITTIVRNQEKYLKNDIIVCTVAYNIANVIENNEAFGLPPSYEEASSLDTLKNYSPTNPWSKEVKNFLSALDVLYNITNEDFTGFTDEEGNDNLEGKVIEAINSYDENLEKYNKEKIDVVCSSKLFLKAISDTITDAFGADGEIIDSTVLTGIKDDGCFAPIDIKSLCSLIKTSGVDIKDIQNIDINNNLLNGNKAKKLDEVTDLTKDSYLVRIIVSSLLNNVVGYGEKYPLQSHKAAFDSNEVMKYVEIKSIFDFVKEYVDNIDDINLESFKIVNLSKFYSTCVNDLEDENGYSPRIISSTISYYILQFNNLYVPVNAVDEYKVLSNSEIDSFLNVYSKFFEDETASLENGFNIEGIDFSDEKVLENLCNSLIVKATLLQNMTFEGTPQQLYYDSECADILSSYVTNNGLSKNTIFITIPNNTEFINFFMPAANYINTADGNIKLNLTLSLDTLVSFYNYLEYSSIYRFMFTDWIINNYQYVTNFYAPTPVNAYILGRGDYNEEHLQYTYKQFADIIQTFLNN